jgi:hypothetical protein
MGTPKQKYPYSLIIPLCYTMCKKMGTPLGIAAVPDIMVSLFLLPHLRTLDRDIDDPSEIRRFLLQLSEMVGRRARKYNVSGKTIHLYVRYADFFSSWGKQTTLKSYINLSDEIYKAALSILATVKLEQPVRLMGVCLSNLKHQAEQLPLFEDESKKLFATQAMDKINDRFGSMAVTFGSLVKGKENAGSHVISPSWRPDGIKKCRCEISNMAFKTCFKQLRPHKRP